MNEAAPKKPAARKSPAKPKEVSPSKEVAQPTPEVAKPVFVKKEIGGYNFDMKQVPAELKELAQTRFGRAGVAMQMAASKANGTYKGEVVNSDHFMAQRVGDNSVVFHKKSDLELVSSEMQWRDKNKTLNRADLAIHYDGSKAKGYPHDPERENLAKMVNVMKKTAENLKVPDLDGFKKSLDAVQGAMWDQMKERRKSSEQTKERPQQERAQEHSR